MKSLVSVLVCWLAVGIAWGGEPASKGDVPSLEGVFRTSVQRVTLVNDLEGGGRHCLVMLQLMWEPKYHPFFMEIGGLQARFAGIARKPMDVETAGQAKQELTGARGTSVTFRLPAPERKNFDHIEFLKGTFSVVLATRMLDFPFDKLANLGKDAMPRVSKIEGVTVTLREVSSAPDRWSFTVQIDNAPGVPSFESYQSWLGNNRIALVKDGGKTTWEPLADDLEVLQETAQRAIITYHFTGNKYLSTTRLADWTLFYTTPHRIVAQPVRYELKKIELP